TSLLHSYAFSVGGCETVDCLRDPQSTYERASAVYIVHSASNGTNAMALWIISPCRCASGCCRFIVGHLSVLRSRKRSLHYGAIGGKYEPASPKGFIPNLFP